MGRLGRLERGVVSGAGTPDAELEGLRLRRPASVGVHLPPHGLEADAPREAAAPLAEVPPLLVLTWLREMVALLGLHPHGERAERDVACAVVADGVAPQRHHAHHLVAQ